MNSSQCSYPPPPPYLSTFNANSNDHPIYSSPIVPSISQSSRNTPSIDIESNRNIIYTNSDGQRQELVAVVPRDGGRVKFYTRKEYEEKKALSCIISCFIIVIFVIIFIVMKSHR